MNSSTKIAPDKRALIAEALADGADLAETRHRLIASGVSPAAADYEIKRAEKDPLVDAALKLGRRLAKRDWLLGIQRGLAAIPAGERLPTIERIETERFFADFYCANRPVKLTGLVDHWPAMKLWSLDYIAAKLGDSMVELQGERESARDYELAKDRHRRMLPMKDVVAAIRQFGSTNEFYVTAYNDGTNKQTLAPLWDDIGGVALLAATGGRDGFFWMGPKGTLTLLHHDLTNNLLVQVVGRKRVRLVPPWELPRLRNRIHCFSEVTLEELESGEIDVLDCVIGPGEAIFLPVGWWHHVEALDVSLSMSFTNFLQSNDFVDGHPSTGAM